MFIYHSQTHQTDSHQKHETLALLQHKLTISTQANVHGSDAAPGCGGGQVFPLLGQISVGQPAGLELQSPRLLTCIR